MIISDELLKEAKKIFQDNSIEWVSLVRGNAFQLQFKQKTFDRVICVNTLLNLPSLDIIETLLVELTRICNANGKIRVRYTQSI
ncbi:MAG TPA: class I SAM-dependent methyltransferase [Candidatus Brocadiaceae bacterium]